MKKQIPAALVVAIGFSAGAMAEAVDAYVDGSTLFIQVDNVNRQAESWATCSATYEVMASLLENTDPAQAQQYRDMSNGAALAVGMTHVMDGIDDDISSESFTSLWNYSRTLIQSMPETQTNMILADAERYSEDDASSFYEKLGATTKICILNLEGQQLYIDFWRDIAKSGLLTIPNE